ncbi:MAG: VOC family protein [Pseudomonadota bacterium]|nr:VOC family protein [Pseudomonadota bacterium]
MTLSHLEHFLIQTEDLEGTCDWYVEVLGMVEGPHPDFKMPVKWLYLGDEPVLHLTVGGDDVSENRKKYLGQQSTATQGSGVVDHVAFRATALQDMMKSLDAKEVPYTKRQVDDQGLFQIFLLDPNGVKIELNFAAAEAKGIRADVMASELTDS